MLRKLYAHELYVEINPADAQREHVRSGDLLTIHSQRGSLNGRALITPAVQKGQLFIAMHYETTNVLTYPNFDPYSHQPAYKASAVALEVVR